MRCLLCQDNLAPLRRREDDVWELSCPRCGTYRFDSAFADLVKRALDRGDTAMLQQCRELADEVRASDTVLTINYDTHVFVAAASA